jgi:hypothetical protein
MQASAHLPVPAALQCDQLTISSELIVIVVTAIAPLARCLAAAKPLAARGKTPLQDLS